eukprot:2270017-Lingulodinium_polyedra.AAC.1
MDPDSTRGCRPRPKTRPTNHYTFVFWRAVAAPRPPWPATPGLAAPWLAAPRHAAATPRPPWLAAPGLAAPCQMAPQQAAPLQGAL